jgi:antitoxin (DNA-binding transcriptional repressor) of toxin-antitoxin stability system
VKAGEVVLVTDRDEIVAELRRSGRHPSRGSRRPNAAWMRDRLPGLELLTVDDRLREAGVGV